MPVLVMGPQPSVYQRTSRIADIELDRIPAVPNRVCQSADLQG